MGEATGGKGRGDPDRGGVVGNMKGGTMRKKALLIVMFAALVLTASCDLSDYLPPPPHSLGWAMDLAEDVRDAELEDGELRLILGDRLSSGGQIVSEDDSHFTFFYGDGVDGLQVRVDYGGEARGHILPDSPGWGDIPEYSSAGSWITRGDAEALDEGLEETDIDVRRLTVTEDFADAVDGVENLVFLVYYSEDDEGEQTKTAEIWLDADELTLLDIEVYPPES
jgi:hypothetical protein